MRKVFWENPYQHTLMTKVAAVIGCQILFEETIVYSFNGGQESDKATITTSDNRTLPIIDSKKDDSENLIYYFLPENHGLKVGDTVEMKIDWQRRYRLMRLHFAAEIVLEIVTKNFKYEKVGAHIAEDKARIDFRCIQNISNLLEGILNEYNEIIKSNKIIELGYDDIKTQRRYWKVDGFGKVPCGGTHVRTTAEVGFVTLKREKANKGIERIRITPVDNSVNPNTFFVHKEFKPLLPEGLKYVRFGLQQGRCLMEAAGLFLNQQPIQIRKDIVNFLNTNPNKAMEIVHTVPVNSSRKKESLSPAIKQLMAKHIPDHLDLSTTESDGDCFFDSLAQALNESFQTNKFTTKAIRKLCHEYVNSGKHEWVKTALLFEEKGEEGYKRYCENVIFTAEEIAVLEQNKRLKDGPIWGRPEIEGKIICDILGIKIHLIEIAKYDGISENILINEHIIDNNKSTPLSEEIKKEIYQAKNVLHIANNQLHYVAVLKRTTLLSPAAIATEVELAERIQAFELGCLWPEQQELLALSFTYQRQVVIFTPGGIQIVNNTLFADSDPVFVFSNNQNHYDGLIIASDRKLKDIFEELKTRYPAITYVDIQNNLNDKSLRK